MTMLTLDIIGLSAFGYEFHAMEDHGSAEQAELRKAYGGWSGVNWSGAGLWGMGAEG
jgi:hypothetical protein